ncbi:MAG TPA: WG repeat-containing protein [Planktothrix sp.]|jgi:hypothetical protein
MKLWSKFLLIAVLMGSGLPALAGDLPAGVEILKGGFATPAPNGERFSQIHGPNGFGVISSTGKIIIQPNYDQAYDVWEGCFIAVKYVKGERQEFLFDIDGQRLADLPSGLWSNPHFEGGLLKLTSNDPLRPRFAFMDSAGHLAFDTTCYSNMGEFQFGLVSAIYVSEGKTYSCLLNKRGEVAYGPYGDGSIVFFKENAAVLSLKTSKGTREGIIDRSGKWIVQPLYTSIQVRGRFGEEGHHYFAQRGSEAFMLTESGHEVMRFPSGCTTADLPATLDKNTVIPCGFGTTANDGYISGKWSYCDMSGKLLFKPKFAVCQPFIGDLAVAFVGDPSDSSYRRAGVIDKRGNWLVEPVYDDVTIADDGHIFSENQPDTWEKPRRDRHYYFHRLLRTTNFIGMRYEDLDRFFGGGVRLKSEESFQSGLGTSIVSYCLTPRVFCGNADRELEFALSETDHVLGWRVTCPAEPSGAWIVKDVTVLDLGKPLTDDNFVPKVSSLGTNL